MQDIDDHLEALVDGLELLAARAAALVDLVFNSLSFAANRNMSLLTSVLPHTCATRRGGG